MVMCRWMAARAGGISELTLDVRQKDPVADEQPAPLLDLYVGCLLPALAALLTESTPLNIHLTLGGAPGSAAISVHGKALRSAVSTKSAALVHAFACYKWHEWHTDSSLQHAAGYASCAESSLLHASLFLL